LQAVVQNGGKDPRQIADLRLDLFELLRGVGADGEAIALSRNIQLDGKQRVALVRQRLDDWLGKNKGVCGINSDGLLYVSTLGAVADIRPLRGLPVEQLSVAESNVSDLRPLEGMPLRRLQMPRTKVTDISVLSTLPLMFLDVSNAPIRGDLSALRGVPLKELYCGAMPVSDLGPLRGMPLQRLMISGTSVTDLSPLRGDAAGIPRCLTDAASRSESTSRLAAP
jgi:hypothetical protein